MILAPIPCEICVNEGANIAIIKRYNTFSSPYLADMGKCIRVFIQGNNEPLPEYNREPYKEELPRMYDVMSNYQEFAECADFVPTN